MISRRSLLQSAALLTAGTIISSVPPISAAAASSLRCPILMYHQIADPPPKNDPFYRLFVSPSEFDTHLALLQEDGYTAITLRTLLDGLINQTPLPEKPVVLTFDDGYINAATQAYPLLGARGMVGTFFIITGVMDTANYLTWGQAGDMQTNGMEIGCHSATHVSLRRLDQDALLNEVAGAGGTIAAVLGTAPVSFCYPYGHFSGAAQQAIKDSGFLGAVTTQNGIVKQDSYCYSLPRVRISGEISGNAFLWMVNQQ